jgi:hypothetical protein
MIPVAVSRGLKQKSIESATIHNLVRRGLSDLEQVEFAWERGWVFVTFHSDYLCLSGRLHSVTCCRMIAS